MEHKKLCKVTFYAELDNSDRNYMKDCLADEMYDAEFVQIHDLSIVDAGDDRTEELLSNLVDYVSINRNIHETITVLKQNGFTDSELKRMGYSAEDIAVCQIDKGGELKD